MALGFARRRALALGALLAALAGCAAPPLQHEPASLAALGTDSVLLVGRIELVPALAPGEQEIADGWGAAAFRQAYEGRAMLRLQRLPVAGSAGAVQFNPRLGATYFFAVPRGARYLSGGKVVMVQRPTYAVELRVPGTLELEIRPADRAVYVGTLRLHRDEFNEVHRVEVIDDWPRAAREFAARYGAGERLRKSLGKPLGGHDA